MKKFFLLTFFAFSLAVSAQTVDRIEPMNWWTGMHNPTVQLMLHGENIGQAEVTLQNANGVALEKVTRTENNNYLFLDLNISPDAKAGTFDIELKKGKKVKRLTYTLLERADGSAERKGFDASDAIMLVMPDRFVNANKENDNIKGKLESADSSAPYGRHGGDLQGVMEHLDYFADLGMTALWLNPVQENDMKEASYHGYAITDYYAVDKRLGTLEDYKLLTQKCHEKGLKMIMDMVFNHCGTNYYWMKDLPTEDWINQWDSYTQSNYRLSTISDPNVSQYDQKLTTHGWFDTTMADMNLSNELVRNYLIQNSIWWIEMVGLDGIRQDTYPYSDKEAMREWNLRVREEYPNFNIVGETWIAQASKLCYWQKDYPNKDGFNSELPTIMDFALQSAIIQGLNEEPSWDGGLTRIYDVLADDHLYPNVNNLLIFGENHDLGRLRFLLGEDWQKVKLATVLVATLRGIPQLYIGSEIGITGNGFAGHCNIREDFPVDKFSAENRTSEENDLYNFTSKLFNYRKRAEALHFGRLVQFLPHNEVYVYFRISDNQTVMVAVNNNSERQTIDSNIYKEILQDYTAGTEVLTDKEINLQNIEINAHTALIIELEK